MSDVPPDHPIAAWLEATRGGGNAPDPVPAEVERGPRLRRLLVATAVACGGALLLAVVAAGRAVPAPTPPARAAANAGTTTDPTPGPVTTAGAGSAVPPAIAGAWDPAAAAAAVLAVRTGVDDREYVDTAAADAITGEGGITLVSVRALVLRRGRGGWTGPEAARFAVPLDPDTLVPAGRAWRLPPAAASAVAVTWQPDHDPDVLRTATDAVAAAGYRRARAVQVRRSPAYPEVVTASLTAVAPGEQFVRRHELWLTAGAERVLGVPAPTHLPVVEEEQ